MNIDFPSAEDFPALRLLWKDAFGDTDEFLDVFERTAFSPDRTRCVFENGNPVAALYLFECSYSEGRIAYIYGVATAKEYRGRGICRSLMENTHAYLKDSGYRAAILVPAKENLYSFYEKLGYKTSCYIDEFHCAPSGKLIGVSKISADEYARLRRELLPKNGVIQENENLDFLKEDADFYKGDGFTLAVREDKSNLFGIELLGNRDVAADITYTLGYDTGLFRTPGKDKPFAMYYALDDKNVTPPSYFGLAFD